ncbi:SGNH/GDSL hydrolase family protein [Parapedobacter indicus]|uniref:GDSL-like Lipase/Acylhydrolase family protein n=1 Tax=Parapedobacter indicus TaxID=1477437 RepID=A0A1I3PFR7_9SPHI|nr:SGNH/GDSL hydrolase family protein [Parapedobacter indicus]PPL00439.1 GDSL-like lipase/acylhydrolase family protein [Parapedobacter indicus]SFJ20261.1 GDSL-like Lipase/Acylhydrolase family protein [Parapedobacter indicus]
MKQRLIIFSLFWLTMNLPGFSQEGASPEKYLAAVKAELQKVWPKNRTVNLVFHGHSVPAGYGDRHEVHTLEAYPHLLLEKLKERYPYAPINSIVTAIGGENSIQGAARFENEVLSHQPDVLFIDYALNDRFQDIRRVKDAYAEMIESALARGINVILLTPSPDQRVDIRANDTPLDALSTQIHDLSVQYNIGFVDVYGVFKRIASKADIKPYMASVNHPNRQGHALIMAELLKWF